jgi:zinc/manganese transport system permease protein
VLARGIIFIDLAIAQIAGLGVILAQSLGWDAYGWLAQVVAAGAALLGAIARYLCERHWEAIQEALIGTAFILAATGGILLLAGNPHGGEHLQDLLAGQILWVGWEQLLPLALLNAVLLALWFGLRGRAGRLAFYLVFALAVTASVQLIGVYLVFASLIIPALASRARQGGGFWFFAWLTGITGYALGLVGSALLDLPSGPAIVWSLALVGVVIWFVLSRQTPR